MKNDSHPATKRDVAIIMKGIGDLYDANKKWKKEIIHEFRIVAEDIRHDCLGVKSDEIEVIKDRVTRLEKHTGLVRA